MSNKRIRSFLYLLVLSLLALNVTSIVAQSENPLPAPTGPYTVGVEWRHWVDESRTEPYVEGTDSNREVIVGFYYPADVADDAEPAQYIDNRDALLPAFAALMQAFVAVPVETQPGDLDAFQSHAYPDAPLSDDQASYPVLIFSHGGAADVRFYTAQLEELASHGYIVAAINHTYGAAVTVLKDGSVAVPTYSTGLEGAAYVWSEDQIFVMDQLEMLNADDPDSTFTNHLDLERLGVFGQSLGGSTSTMTCFVDARCKASASGDGTLYGDVIEQGLDQPFLLLQSGSRFALPGITSDRGSYDALRGPFYAVSVENFAHLNFGDYAVWPNVETLKDTGWLGDADGARSIEVTNSALVAFFDQYLKSEGDMEEALSAYPEVTVTSRNTGSESSETAHRDTLNRVAQEGLTEGDASILEQFIADDYVVHSPFGDLNRDAVRGLFDGLRAAMTDFQVTRENMVLEDNSAAMRTILTGTFDNEFSAPFGTFQPSGEPFRLEIVNIFQFNEEGTIQEEWAQFDTSAFMAQLSAASVPEAETTPEATAGMTGITQEFADAFAEQFNAIFDGPNLEIADEIMAENFVGHAPLAPELDRQGWKDYVASFYMGMSDLKEEVNEVIVGEDRVVLRVTYTGTHDGPFFGIPATGNTVTFDGIGIFRFDENGLAVENWAVVDVVGLMAQIGGFPPPQ